MAKKTFDLGAMLKDVSNLDTNADRIQKIRLDLIDDDPENFYKVDGIGALADNIATCGLMDPIRVRPHPDEDGRYIIVSGHRRRSAVAQLAREEPEKWNNIPCIVETGDFSPALQQLRLIYANSDTRTMTAAEISEQAEQVEKLLYMLQEEGHEFPGRMRDHVAQACHVSQSKLARLKVIRAKLQPEFRPAFEKDIIKESTAYALAQLPIKYQRAIYNAHKERLKYLYESDVKRYSEAFKKIDQIRCPDTMAPCEHTYQMYNHKSAQGPYSCDCSGCCIDCSSLVTCKDACFHARNEKDRQKRDRKLQRAEERRAKEEKERPVIELIQGIYERIGQRRKAVGASVHDLYSTIRWLHTGSPSDKTQQDRERGHATLKAYDRVPLASNISAGDIRDICAVADLLKCSVDYLLGRETPVSDSDTWHTGNPVEPGKYVVLLRYAETAPVAVEQVTWNGQKWDEGLVLEDTEILKWISMPD